MDNPSSRIPTQTVEKLLASKGARVERFALFVVGEGIEKKTGDFAEEVRAAAGMK